MAREQLAIGTSDYARIEHALRFLQANAQRQPSLNELADELGLSEFHLQRLFQRWAGVSPKRFLQAVTIAQAKALLREQRSVLDTSFAVGLSSASRLHDLFVSVERMTPGEFQAGAAGLTVRWGVLPTPLGDAQFAVLEDRGLCGLHFLSPGDNPRALLSERWPGAKLVEDPKAVKPHAETLKARLAGELRPIGLVLKGTELQLKVWEALLRIPQGQVTTYGELARNVGAPAASRAVGSAIGRNPIGVLIPCHRVIQATGALGGYRWGLSRKLALLGREYAHGESRSA
ncbi:MAG: bifunctional transcriptional activator/DNA repair enzyme AdaA [Myxococcaceae bacterium]